MDGHVTRGERALALCGIVAFLGFSLGCLSLNIGGRTEVAPPAEAGATTGRVTIPAGQSQDVFYPHPYAATPNLVVEGGQNTCTIEDQLPNRFRVHNPGPFAREITWKARGEKVSADVLIQNAKAGTVTPANDSAVVPASVRRER